MSILLKLMYVLCLVAQSYLTLCDPVIYSLPGSSVHEILQARILEWVAMPPPGDPPNPGIKPRSPALQAGSLPSEPPGKLNFLLSTCFATISVFIFLE